MEGKFWGLCLSKKKCSTLTHNWQFARTLVRNCFCSEFWKFCSIIFYPSLLGWVVWSQSDFGFLGHLFFCLFFPFSLWISLNSYLYSPCSNIFAMICLDKVLFSFIFKALCGSIPSGNSWPSVLVNYLCHLFNDFLHFIGSILSSGISVIRSLVLVDWSFLFLSLFYFLSSFSLFSRKFFTLSF